VAETHDQGITTAIEGDTKHGGSANGYEVARWLRHITSCDFAMVAA